MIRRDRERKSEWERGRERNALNWVTHENENHRKRKCAFAWIKSIECLKLIYAIRCWIRIAMVSRTSQATHNHIDTHRHTCCARDSWRIVIKTVAVCIYCWLLPCWLFFHLLCRVYSVHGARSLFCIRFHISNLSFYLCNFSVLFFCCWCVWNIFVASLRAYPVANNAIWTNICELDSHTYTPPSHSTK